jgi:endoglucanase
VVAYDFKPDVVIALDSTPAHDLPMWDDSENTVYNTKLDCGPAIYVSDRATLSDPRLIRHFAKTANAHHIPYQLRQPGMGGTDAGSLHRTGEGALGLSISIPGRYAHSPIMLARVADWQAGLNLVHYGLSEMGRSLFTTERQ